jgi:sec-independent protein translocase protein TatC
MARPLAAPIGHEEQLTLVDHLGELRTRLLYSLAFVSLAFAFTFWKADFVLGVITKPIDNALSTTKSNNIKKQSADEIQFGYQQKISKALMILRQNTADSAKALDQLGNTKAATADAATAASVAVLQAQIAKRQAVLDKIDISAPPIERRPVTLGVTEPFLVTITSSLYAAILISIPFLLFQAYAFIIPAFTPRERKIALPLMLMVPFLFLAGVLFAYYLVLPQATNFLLNFNDSEFNIQVQANQAVKFTTSFLIAIGLMFQLPVGILALTRSGIVSVPQLRAFRRYAIVLFAVIAAVLTPTPDPGTMLLAMSPLVVLYEFSILMAAWLERRRPLDPVVEEEENALDHLSDTYAPLPSDDD